MVYVDNIVERKCIIADKDISGDGRTIEKDKEKAERCPDLKKEIKWIHNMRSIFVELIHS